MRRERICTPGSSLAHHRASRTTSITAMRRANPSIGRSNRPLAETAQPEALFVLSAVAQYIGAAIAVLLFDQVEPQTVAWFRIIGASIALLAVSRGWRSGLDSSTVDQRGGVRHHDGADEHLLLPCDRPHRSRQGVTIEFIGPITVAADRDAVDPEWCRARLCDCRRRRPRRC